MNLQHSPTLPVAKNIGSSIPHLRRGFRKVHSKPAFVCALLLLTAGMCVAAPDSVTPAMSPHVDTLYLSRTDTVVVRQTDPFLALQGYQTFFFVLSAIVAILTLGLAFATVSSFFDRRALRHEYIEEAERARKSFRDELDSLRDDINKRKSVLVETCGQASAMVEQTQELRRKAKEGTEAIDGQRKRAEEMVRSLLEQWERVSVANAVDANARVGSASDTSTAHEVEASKLVSEATKLVKSGRYDDALVLLAKALTLNPSSDQALALRGQAYSSVGKRAEALSDQKKAVHLNPKNVFARTQLAFELYMVHDFEGAIREASEAITIDPSQYAPYSIRGLALDASDRHDQAMTDFDMAVERAETSEDWPLVLRGDSRMAHHDIDGAINDLTRARQVKPDTIGTLVSLGEAFAMKKDYQSARRCMVQALAHKERLAQFQVAKAEEVLQQVHAESGED